MIESEGEGGLLWAREIEYRWGHTSWLVCRWGIDSKGKDLFSTKKVLYELYVKVVFHHTAVFT